MNSTILTERLRGGFDPQNRTFPFPVSSLGEVQVYNNSLNAAGESMLFLGMAAGDKFLWVHTPAGAVPGVEGFEGRSYPLGPAPGSGAVMQCELRHDNAEAIRRILPFTRPVVLGLRPSIGLGDRLGLANPGHLRAVAGTGFRPVLAQQSVRELERTMRETEDVMDAATWAVFQEGFRDGFGADADHLKTPEDIDRYARAGFTMYTLDVGAHVVNEAMHFPIQEVRNRAQLLPWAVLNDSLEGVLGRYAGRQIMIESDMVLSPSEEEVLRAVVKYGAGIAQAVRLCRHLKDRWSGLAHEIELSVDETDSPTTPLEHLIVAGELKRLGVVLVSLAPRFIGDFEKGIEYKGDLEAFRREFLKHAAIARRFGPYKISIHSGSDKFDVYKVIGSLGVSAVHVKTAGTSWLEALRAIAVADPELFREILDRARLSYDNDRRSYHVSAKVELLRPTKSYTSHDLRALLDDANARQILHVTFGSILTATDEQGVPLFKDRILECLRKNEGTHYGVLSRHISRHLAPLLGHRQEEVDLKSTA
jgi:tagaturonate epimerase